MVVTEASDIGVIIDWGNPKSGDMLLRREEGEWLIYLDNGGPVSFSFALSELQPGIYRLTCPRRLDDYK